MTENPKHVAIIMDGNGRWAKSHNLPRLEGHRKGALTVRRIVEEARRLGIEYLTLFSFSTENWNRTEDEVSGLMKLLRQYLISELALLKKNNIRLKAIGDIDRLPKEVREALKETESVTSEDYEMTLVLAISYGGREDIVEATKAIAKRALSGEISIDNIDNDIISQNLWTKDIPDPDLLIRTSGENRISNFLLWQLAYSEIVISPKLWPDFSHEDFSSALSEYSERDRRFGLNCESKIKQYLKRAGA